MSTSGTTSAFYSEPSAMYHRPQVESVSRELIEIIKQETIKELIDRAPRKLTPTEKAAATKAENKRRAEKLSVVGRFVHLEHTHPSESSANIKEGVRLCLRESERSIFCVNADRKSSSEEKYVLDRREQKHWIITRAWDDTAALHALCDTYFEFIEQGGEQYDSADKYKDIFKLLCETTAYTPPVRSKERFDLTTLINGEVQLSRKMEAIIRSQFCSDYQRKVTPLMKQLALEIFTTLQNVFEQPQNTTVVVVKEPPEKRTVPDRRPLLYLPDGRETYPGVRAIAPVLLLGK